MLKNKKRIGFLVVFLLLTILEFIIGLYVHDNFVRPYLGDTIIVIVLFAFVRIFVPDDHIWISGAILVFAIFVELSQLIPLVDLLGIKNTFLRALMGTSFAFEDLIAYLAGSVLTFIYDLLFNSKKSIIK